MSLFAIYREDKNYKRLCRQFDELSRCQSDTAAQLDKLAREIEQSRVSRAVLRLNREILPSVSVKMEII